MSARRRGPADDDSTEVSSPTGEDSGEEAEESQDTQPAEKPPLRPKAPNRPSLLPERWPRPKR